MELLKEAAQKSHEEGRSALEVNSDEVMVPLLGKVCEGKGQKDLVNALVYIAVLILMRCSIFSYSHILKNNGVIF
ncbi:MAG: hypothetical protein F6K48_13725 [Okeania sp. SIO3H1]|nr:hypothetical protein [Okeania sp. SIO3H1]